ncbi:MAG TPA: response regulator transcription factor [Spirochaetota bacterium]|nr:response regulator transcription factor [Spirochaetota bacterium]
MAKPSVLIADDMLTVQHNLSFILQAYDYDVVYKASNCSETIAGYREFKPDIVLLDILGMNSFFDEENREIDTFDTIKLIVKDNKDANIIVLTATPKEEYIKKALMCGAKGFLVKGVSNDKIISTIEDVLKKRK